MIKILENKQRVIYVLVVGFLVSVISIFLLLLTRPVFDKDNQRREVNGVGVHVDNSTDVSRQSSDRLPNRRATNSENGREEVKEDLADREDISLSNIEIALNEVKEAIREQDVEALYRLLSSELTETFDSSSLKEGWEAVEGLTLESEGEPVLLSDEYARQEMLALSESGQRVEYTVVMHQEEGEWRLFGTIPN